VWIRRTVTRQRVTSHILPQMSPPDLPPRTSTTARRTGPSTHIAPRSKFYSLKTT
jgi:hypothetical protein